MGVRHPHPPSPAGWAPPSPAMRERGWRPLLPSSPSPALRVRVPSAARRVRVGSRNFIYREPLSSRNAEQERSPAPPIVDRCRAAHVVGAAGSAPDAIQVSPATSDRRLYRRLRMHPACISDRTRRWPTRGQWGGCAANGLARKSRLARNPVLEQRGFNQYRGCGRSYPARASRAISPHPPSPAGRAPPSPAVRERGSRSLIPYSPSPAMRERVPSAARRVRVSPR
jgi:hypothetical protein